MPKSQQPLRRPTDTPAMSEALDWLEERGVRFSRPTEYQLKIGPFNFYPGTGTIYRDRERQPHPERGLAALEELLRPQQKITLSDLILDPAEHQRSR